MKGHRRRDWRLGFVVVRWRRVFGLVPAVVLAIGAAAFVGEGAGQYEAEVVIADELKGPGPGVDPVAWGWADSHFASGEAHRLGARALNFGVDRLRRTVTVERRPDRFRVAARHPVESVARHRAWAVAGPAFDELLRRQTERHADQVEEAARRSRACLDFVSSGDLEASAWAASNAPRFAADHDRARDAANRARHRALARRAGYTAAPAPWTLKTLGEIPWLRLFTVCLVASVVGSVLLAYVLEALRPRKDGPA